jgi:hypothetical protein
VWPNRAELTGFATACKNLWQTSAGALSTNIVKLTRVRAAAIDSEGHTPRDPAGAYQLGDSVVNLPAGGTGPNMAPQVALVVSLNSALEDLTGRGRFYLPMPAVALGDDLLISAADATMIAGRMKQLVEGINAAASGLAIGRVCVASGGSLGRSIAPANRPVISVGVGRALDTMRSRRAQLLEARIEQTIAA